VNDNLTDNQQRDALLAKLTAYEGSPNAYMNTCTESDLNRCPYIISAGLTPTAGTLGAAISYFNGTYAQDGPPFSSPIQSGAATCQKSSIVYVTDGLPSVDENGGPGTADSLMPAVLDKLRALRNLAVTIGGTPYNCDIQTYIVGAGLTTAAKANLDAMAVAGGTEVDGHAYYADNETELENALDQILNDIQSSTYSFSPPSVSTVRLQDENYLYTAAFDPKASDPLWKGHLKKFQVQDDGSIGNAIWDAGDWLAGPSADNRVIRTLIGGSLTDFKETLLSPTYFGLASSQTEQRDQIVGYIRGKATLPSGGVQLPNTDSSIKLGDIFHSNPITIGSPSLFFNDPRDKNLAFDKFRKDHQRTSSDGSRIIVAGANDGQLHAFETGTGAEKWSFIPPSLLPKLDGLAHVSHPPSKDKKHQYFVDGPLSAADVWLPATVNDGTAKNESEWHTLLVSGLGMGARGPGSSTDYLWSKDQSCDDQFKDKYNPPYQYYCGYYAFDVTNTAAYPSFKWILNPGRDDGPYLGEPWSKMVMGRVKINGNERWVGFIGGGYTMGTPPRTNTGKGFFVVDLTNGTILWRYTAKDNSSMSFIPGTPAIVDKDSDGFVDTAYVGDLAGNMWKFTFCPNDPVHPNDCGLNNWTASVLYSSQSNLPTFNTPTVAKDAGYYWVFWGTGDKANPNNIAASPNSFFAVRDDNPSGSYILSNLQNITPPSAVFNDPGAKGWYVNLGQQERVLSDATVYKGIVFFTSYTPATGSAALYGIAMMPVSIMGHIYDPGKGVFSELGQRKIDLGAGIPSAPVVSQKPLDGSQKGGTPDVFVGVSGGAGMATQILSSANPNMGGVANALTGAGPSSQIIHWRDRRVQPY
jgi:type IV pilus assembly protein PilY1